MPKIMQFNTPPDRIKGMLSAIYCVHITPTIKLKVINYIQLSYILQCNCRENLSSQWHRLGLAPGVSITMATNNRNHDL